MMSSAKIIIYLCCLCEYCVKGQERELKGCTLKETMELKNCKGPKDFKEAVTEELFQSSDVLVQKRLSESTNTDQDDDLESSANTFSRKTTDGELDVVHGVVCAADTNLLYSPILKCNNGVWTAVYAFKGSQHQLRKKEAYVDIPEQQCRRRCRGWWLWRRCHTDCWTNYRRNYIPEIFCPVIPIQEPAPGKAIAVVTWESATAIDREDGQISVRQTAGPKSNTSLPAGSYTISYEVKDNSGYSAYCSNTFSVVVHTCPTSTVNTSSVYYISHGSTSCSAHNIYGSVCSYECDDGYQMQGSHKIECLYDETWSEIKPKCILITKCSKPVAVDQGEFQVCGPNYDVYSSCILTCKAGYQIIGPQVTTCQIDGTWTATGTCKDIEKPTMTCPDPILAYSKPKKQPVSVMWTQPNVTDNSGEFITATCSHQSGQLFPVGQTLVTFQAADSAHNVANCSMIVTVEVRHCDSLQVPDNSNMTCNYDTAEGSDCDFTCRPGFDIQGSSLRTCQSDLTWSNSAPTCKRLTCPAAPTVVNGNYDCPDGYWFEAVCSLQCVAGYTLINSTTIKCLSNLAWSSTGSCIDDKPPVFLSCPNVVEFASILGQATYVDFPMPQVTDNSGKTVTMSASPSPKTEFKIGETNVTVTATDVSENTATCIFTVTVRAIECINPSSANLDASGKDLMVFTCPQGYVYGARCNVSCNNGNPIGGASSIVCERNETDLGTGYWSYGISKPFCDGKTCSKPVVPTYGAIACDVISNKDTCMVLCNKNYSFPKGDLENGLFYCSTLNGEWMPRDISTSLCYPAKVATSVVLMPEINYYSTKCSSMNEEIKTKFIQNLNASNIFGTYCQEVTCSIDTVTVTCGSRSKRSIKLSEMPYKTYQIYMHNMKKRDIEIRRRKLVRRKKSLLDVINTLTFTITISFMAQDKPSKTSTFYGDLALNLSMALDDATAAGNLNLPELGETDEHSFGFGYPTYTCPKPTLFQAQTAMCVGCGKGYIFSGDLQDCTICPIGSYQELVEGTNCQYCPQGFSTLKEGTDSLNGCLEFCSVGTFSKSGLKPCDPCPKGSYQSKTGQRNCIICPFGMSTADKGSIFEHDCTFYNTVLKYGTKSAAINMSEWQSLDFTFLARINVPSDLTDTRTTFSLTPTSDTAAIGGGGYMIYIKKEIDSSRKNRRQWYHLSAINSGNVFMLYVDGVYMEQKSSINLANFTNFIFLPSTALPDLTLSDLQLSNTVLTEKNIKDFTAHCGWKLSGNILTSENIMASLVLPSTCDAEDGCSSNPCGDHGVCIDLEKEFLCSCEQNWFGQNCQNVTDFCNGNHCGNGASCINNYMTSNYSCDCLGNFTGTFCTVFAVNGGWSAWSNWEFCPVSCGGAIQKRTRVCNSPPPDENGKPCKGESTEAKNCSTQPCPIDGGVSAWSEWQCPVTCGTGTAHRSRRCDKPPAQYGGRNCTDTLEEFKICDELNPCPGNGSCGPWSDWTSCSATCGGGQKQRTCVCDSPPPQYGGADCDPTIKIVSCNTQTCPACPKLRRSGQNIQDINCTYDIVTAMDECYIICKKGFMTDDIKYTCGKLSNYTWSQVTKDNPLGLLPDCTKCVPVEEKSVMMQVEYPTATQDSKSAVTEQVKSNMAATLNDSCSTCVYTVTAETTYSRKRAASVILMHIIMNVSTPYIDPVIATDDQIEMISSKIVEFEVVTQTIYNKSKDIFKVMINGQDIPAILPPRVLVYQQCPSGSQPLAGLCVYCPPGSFENNSRCILCDVGQYQDNEGKRFCIPCPEGTSTAGKGAQSQGQCVANPCIYLPLELGYWDVALCSTKESTSPKASTLTNSSNVGLIVGLVLGLTALIVAIIVSFIIIKKYFFKNRPASAVAPFYELSHRDISFYNQEPPPYFLLEQKQ